MSEFRLPPLNALRVFEAAARRGSFKAAAEELNVTPSAVSHRVANLEAVLGTSLFRRDGRGLTLSEAGQVYQRRIHDALSRLADATEEVVRGAAVPALTVLSAPSFASRWLMPRLDGFLRANPEMRVRVEAAAGQTALGDADVGVLYGRPMESGLTVRPIIAERIVVLCSPALLARGPAIREPRDLASHVLIHARNRLQWRRWLGDRGLDDLVIRREMSVGHSAMAIEAAVDGLGVILESDFLAAAEIADGRLLRLFDDEPTAAEDAYFLVTRGAVSEDSPAGCFVDWLLREAGLSR